MIDMQGYDVGDALRCVCGEIIGHENTKIIDTNEDDGSRREIVITCEHCSSMLIMVIVPSGAVNT